MLGQGDGHAALEGNARLPGTRHENVVQVQVHLALLTHLVELLLLLLLLLLELLELLLELLLLVIHTYKYSIYT